MSEPASSRDPFQLCGTTIEGKYRIASVVGDGGFGVVYRGVHKGFGELIAVKCLKLPKELDEQQRESFLEQLKEEGRLLHRLSKATPGIVQALDVGAVTAPNGAWVPYLVLEWLEGKTLAEFIKDRETRGEKAMPVAEAIRLLEPAARALAVAHRQKVAHRDVKPPNLFVTEALGARTVKVLDFGIAKVLTEYPSFTEALAQTKAGPTAFTPRYGAPEQFNKQRGASGPWTDVFALALIFVELVTGRKALDGDDPTQLYIASADPSLRPTARGRGAEVSDAVERVIDKALSVEPKYRYPDAGEFWDALVAAAAVESAAASPTAVMGGKDLTPMRAALSTEEFAANVLGGGALSEAIKSSQRAKEASDKRPTALAQTMPAESIDGADRAPAAVISRPVSARGTSPGPPNPEARSSRPSGRPSPTEKNTRTSTEIPHRVERTSTKGPPSDDDPMAETPLLARAPSQPSPSRAPQADAFEPAPPPSSLAPSSRTPSRSAWPWIGAAMLAGAAGGVFYLQQDHASPKPVASANVSAKPKPSATPSPIVPISASSSASPVKSGAPVTAPAPDDMIRFAPRHMQLGEGSSARDVTLTHAWFLDKREVTAKDYLACVNARKCSAADKVSLPPEMADGGVAIDEYVATWSRRCTQASGELDHPINCVDFASAEGFCRFKNKRLPTEAEWEMAARGESGRVYPWGEDAPDCARSCFDRNGGKCQGNAVATCAEGERAGDRTPEGLVDLGGNVSEWVSDGFVESPAGGRDPHGDASSTLRVVRGGSFLDEGDRLKATSRLGASPSTGFVAIGFRCAMDAD